MLQELKTCNHAIYKTLPNDVPPGIAMRAVLDMDDIISYLLGKWAEENL